MMPKAMSPQETLYRAVKPRASHLTHGPSSMRFFLMHSLLMHPLLMHLMESSNGVKQWNLSRLIRNLHLSQPLLLYNANA